jgi:hypothetical protein
MTTANPRFLLGVDDAGEFLVVAGERVRLGHLRAADVDLPFLSDVPSNAARIELEEDFHAGARWRIAPESGVRLEIDGTPVGPAGAVLRDGVVVRVARNLAFRFVARERGTSAARLELAGGVECLGAPRILLLPPGAGGRARIGAQAGRTIPVHGLDHEVEIEAERSADADGRVASLSVRCVAGIATAPRSLREPEARFALPLALQLTLVARARGAAKPPFALILRPAEPPLEP